MFVQIVVIIKSDAAIECNASMQPKCSEIPDTDRFASWSWGHHIVSIISLHI